MSSLAREMGIHNWCESIGGGGEMPVWLALWGARAIVVTAAWPVGVGGGMARAVVSERSTATTQQPADRPTRRRLGAWAAARALRLRIAKFL